jgi:hypothetical protein
MNFAILANGLASLASDVGCSVISLTGRSLFSVTDHYVDAELLRFIEEGLDGFAVRDSLQKSDTMRMTLGRLLGQSLLGSVLTSAGSFSKYALSSSSGRR